MRSPDVRPPHRPRIEALDYVLSTRTVIPRTAPALHVLGYAASDQAVYVATCAPDLHPLDARSEPWIERIAIGGAYAGQRVPMASWYEVEALGSLPARLARLARSLAPLASFAPQSVTVGTRVLHARGVRVDDGAPIRKFALEVTLRTPGADATRLQLEAYGRPAVTVQAAWHIPRESFAVVALGLVASPDDDAPHQALALVPRRQSARITIPMAAVSAA